jgi:hypothetical protein
MTPSFCNINKLLNTVPEPADINVVENATSEGTRGAEMSGFWTCLTNRKEQGIHARVCLQNCIPRDPHHCVVHATTYT